METQDVLQKVKKVDIVVRKSFEGMIAGSYRAVFRGKGIEFSEIREYLPGDDVRTIDWKVTARFNHPFIKKYIEERNVNVYVLFDLSGSGNFGTSIQKRHWATQIAATLMFSAMKYDDPVGLVTFTDKVETYIPAKKGKKHALRIIHNLVDEQYAKGKTDLREAIRFTNKLLRRRSLIFIISDFLTGEFTDELDRMARKHDVIALRVRDMHEAEVPDVGLIRLEDEETGEQLLVDTSDKAFRKEMEEALAKEDDRLKKLFARHDVDHVDLRSDESFILGLKRLFAKRKRRMSW